MVGKSQTKSRLGKIFATEGVRWKKVWVVRNAYLENEGLASVIILWTFEPKPQHNANKLFKHDL